MCESHIGNGYGFGFDLLLGAQASIQLYGVASYLDALLIYKIVHKITGSHPRHIQLPSIHPFWLNRAVFD